MTADNSKKRNTASLSKVDSVPLSELCKVDRRTMRPDDPSAASLPFIGVENVTSMTGALDFDRRSRIGNRKSPTFRFDERHVLYATLRPYLNKVATPDFAGLCSTQLVPLLPRQHVDRDFLAYLLRRRTTVDFAMSSARGARMPSTDMDVLMSMPAPFPPPDRQRKIVNVLKRTDRIRRLQTQVSDRLRDFPYALFSQLFEERSNDSKRSKIAVLDEVTTAPLGELCDVDRRAAQPNDPTVASLPFVGMENVESDTGRLDLAAGSRIGNRKSAAFRFDERHVLYAKLRPYLNKVATPDFTGICSTELVPLRPRSGVDRYFLANVLRRRSTVKFAIASSTGARMPRTDMNALMSMPAPFPPPAEQRRFGDILVSMERTARKIGAASQTAAALRESLMARLFGDDAGS